LTVLSLSKRQLVPEVMDDPALDPHRHFQALKGLNRINRISSSGQSIWQVLTKLANAHTNKPLRVLDIATGAGDVPISLYRRAQKQRIDLLIDACDISNRAVTYAQQQAKHANADIRFFQLDVVRQPIPSGYDVIISSLFFHHLDDQQMLDLLKKMAQATGQMVLINDLRRGWTGLLAAYIATHLVTRSHVVHTDGPRSVRAACTIDEFQSLAHRAHLKGATVKPSWPMRMMLVWSRP